MNLDDLTPIGRSTHEALLAAGKALDGSSPAGGVDDLLNILVAARSDRPDRPMPAHIGRFEILRELGGGGQGVVYLARDPRLCCLVALKVSHAAALLAPGNRDRLWTEARAVAALDHPNIVPLRELIDDGPLCGLVMPFIDGPSLSQWLKATPGPVSPRLAAAMMADLARAVAHAHARNVLHRDIKPGNILLQPSPDGDTPRLADFGLAYLRETADSDHEQTPSNARLGTTAYMSPESAAGKAHAVDERSDIYSLGATLYELLTGRPPFEGSNVGETLTQVLLDEPIPPRRLRPGLPRDLETVVLRAMAKDPADRYVTAAELAEDLRRFLSGEPIQAQRPSLGVRLRSWITRHRLLSLFTVVTAVAAPGMLSLLVWSTSEAQRRSRAESENRRLSRATSVYRLQQAVARLKDHKVGEARELLRAIEEYPGDFDLNSFAWRRVRNWADRVIVPVSTEPINHAAPSPDGKYLIGLKASDNIFEPIHVIERSTLRPVRTTPNPGVPLGYVPQFSPDGRLMAGIESPAVPNQPHRVFVWEIEGGRLLAETRVPAGARASTPVMVADDMVVIEEFPKVGAKSTLRLWQIQSERRELRIVRTITDKAYRWFVARDGRTAGYLENVGDGSRLMLADLLNGSTRELSGASQPQRKITQARLSHDGSLLILHVHSEIQFWETATGREIARYDVGHFAYWGQVSLNPDARAATVWDPGALTLTIWDRDRGRSHVLRPRVNPGKANLSVSFTPDGTRIAVWLAESTDPEALTVWDVATGNRLAVAPSDALPLRTLRFAPDGREIIIVRDPTAMVWRLDPDAPTKLAGHGDEAWAVAFSRAGDLLASGCDDEGGDETNTIKLWDPKNGRLLRGWSGGVGTVSSVAFAPDGLTLASAHFDEPGSVRLWDVATGKLLASLEGHTAKARSVAFHPSGRWLASASSDRTVRIWDVAARRCVHVLQGHQKTIQEVAFSPDGKILATAGDDGTVRLWDFASGKPTQALQGGKIMSVAFSSDGTLLAAAEASGQVRLWNTETGTARATLNCGHTILHALAFSPRGETLAVADMSGRIQLWDIPSLQELFSLQDEGPQINGLAFSPDGTTIAGASHDGTVRLWR